MKRIWIGDSRTVGMQGNSFISDVDNFIAKTGMSYSWFKNTALTQLVEVCDQDGTNSVIIMMGVNDCAGHTTGGSLQADNYATTVNELIRQYPYVTFYFCSVNPVDADYPSAYHPTGKIPKEDLNNAIKKFNKIIKSKCNAKYIDSHGYLESTGFSTRDGIHYNLATTKSIYEYVVNFITSNAVTIKYLPRLEAPTDNDAFWVNVENTVENPEAAEAEVISGRNPCPKKTDSGFVLPSNTGYVWGRFSEILKLDANLPDPTKTNAEDWFDTTVYETGSEPQVGAIICWAGGIVENEADVKGHVAVVEQIIDNNTIIISESINKTATVLGEVFRTSEINNDNENWGKESFYTFKGFIYNPGITISGIYVDSIDKSQVISVSGRYLTSKERELNARYICKYLTGCGWSLNAIAGLLGNLEHESSINPGITEFDGSGYGLVQWTPPSKFTDWCDKQNPPLPHDDVDSQLARIEWERTTNFSQYRFYTQDQYGTVFTGSAGPFGPETFNKFATSTKTPFDLACAFLYNYEKPASIIYGANKNGDTSAYYVGLSKTPEQREAYRVPVRKQRGDCAEKWYKYLLDYCGTGEKLSVGNLKVTDEKTTSAKVSFLVQNGKDYSYTLKSSNAKISDRIVKSVAIKENTHLICFTIKNLIPNTKYTLSVTVTGLEENSKEELDAVAFTTLQDYPGPVKGIVLQVEKLPLPDQSFKVTVTPPEYWGYWKKNNYGYLVELVLDGYHEEVFESSIFSDFTFIPRDSTQFGKKNIKIGTNLQIGIRTWVEDDFGNKIYNNSYSTTSNSICLLNQPIRVYLNTK